MESGYVWLVTYNAQEEGYETAWIGPSLRGLSDHSKLIIESNDGDKYVLLEEFQDEGDEVKVRHEIQPQENGIQWVVYESKNGQDFRKVLQHDMKRKEMDITKK